MTNPKVVVLCMENRSFDEYFGTFPKAVGFRDPNGAGIFAQPHVDHEKKIVTVRPFRASTFSTKLSADPDHTWSGAQTTWNWGAMNGWSKAQGDGFFTSMSYFAANDIPYHWQLAQTFLLCDTYHCSVLGPTWPNRLFLMSGTIFAPPSPAPGSVITFQQKTDLPGLNSQNNIKFPWKSYAAMLGADTTWTLYDDQRWGPYWLAWPGITSPPSYLGGWTSPWDLNMLDCLCDADGKHGGAGTAGQSNYAATARDAVSSRFETDALAGDLPDISWLVPPFYCTEHPAYLPADGECYLSRVVNAVIESPDWESPGIVLIITYDENGGFFDHVTPPTSQEGNPEDEPWVTDGDQTGPVGGGFRMPTIIVSPWTVGGHLSSSVAKDAVFDHTSVIQYLEELTNVTCANLPLPGWRRATFSSLRKLIDRSRTPVPRSAIDIASPAQVDIWRSDALARLYGGDKALPAPWPLPTQAWPPLEQQCRFVPDKIEIKRQDSASHHGEEASTTYPAAFFFVAEGFEPGELNLGAFAPKNFRPLKPVVDLTIKDAPKSFRVRVEVGDAVGDIALPPVPQSFRFPCTLEFDGDWPTETISIDVEGRFTSRLTWTAPAAKIVVDAAS